MLRDLVAIIREEGSRYLGMPVRVGATFDPGPEFAVSPFKYERHPEICMSATMGAGSFVTCYSVLRGDERPYAGFPGGIPDGTPFGTFFGRRSRHSLTDIGFDYIWFSNGFGFGAETWSANGVVFDGSTFDTGKTGDVKNRILEFWCAFRAECNSPVETRGTNMSVGMGLSSDAVPFRDDIHSGGFDIETPPNSPRAALDGDFGLELAGWMSRIAELPPGNRYPFRFYTHDP